jgi:hypothetical protein
MNTHTSQHLPRFIAGTLPLADAAPFLALLESYCAVTLRADSKTCKDVYSLAHAQASVQVTSESFSDRQRISLRLKVPLLANPAELAQFSFDMSISNLTENPKITVRDGSATGRSRELEPSAVDAVVKALTSSVNTETPSLTEASLASRVLQGPRLPLDAVVTQVRRWLAGT